MKFTLQEGHTPSDINLGAWEVALHGQVIDDRGASAKQEIDARSNNSHEIVYQANSLEVQIDGQQVGVDDLIEEISSKISGSVVLEATTLGFVEILLCSKALFSMGLNKLDVVYVEPEQYRRPRRGHLLHRRDFELSDDVPGYRAIPGSAILLGDRRPQRGVFFLGYEEARLRRAFEELQMIRSAQTSLVFGVPAFKPGWEMDSLANNISVVREQNIRGGIHYCGAENPASVAELLSELLKGMPNEERLFVAPIGTKPHGVGVALFVARNPQVGVIYDHPQRISGRSTRVGRWHLFTVEEFAES